MGVQTKGPPLERILKGEISKSLIVNGSSVQIRAGGGPGSLFLCEAVLFQTKALHGDCSARLLNNTQIFIVIAYFF